MNRSKSWITGSVAVVAILCLSGIAQQASAATAALSFNFTSGAAGKVVGTNTAGVGGYGNWNDLSGWSTAGNTADSYFNTPSGADLGAGLGTFKLSDGSTASGVKIQINSTSVTDSHGSSGASAGDAGLMASGLYISIYPNGQNVHSPIINIEGLTSIFTNGYTVALYQAGAGSSNASGTAYLGTNKATEYFAPFTPNYNGVNPVNYAATDTTVGWATSGAVFTGTFTPGTFYESVPGPFNVGPGAGGVGQDSLVIGINPTGGTNNGAFNLSAWTGVQIIGEVNAVPEPSSIVLAGLGLVGLVGFGLRRRSRKCA